MMKKNSSQICKLLFQLHITDFYFYYTTTSATITLNTNLNNNALPTQSLVETSFLFTVAQSHWRLDV